MTRLLISNCRLSGNEADYVILSSVRTKWPGFLKSQPRMNVALTRCRKGMVVVTTSFYRAREETLLGQLCAPGQNTTSVERLNAVLNNAVTLPGLPVPLSRRMARQPIHVRRIGLSSAGVSDRDRTTRR